MEEKRVEVGKIMEMTMRLRIHAQSHIHTFTPAHTHTFTHTHTTTRTHLCDWLRVDGGHNSEILTDTV
jgi:hypothetical protein